MDTYEVVIDVEAQTQDIQPASAERLAEQAAALAAEQAAADAAAQAAADRAAAIQVVQDKAATDSAFAALLTLLGVTS